MEIVHQILDDTPVLQILEIVACNNDFLNRCLFAHMYYGKLFSNEEDLITVRQLFVLWKDIVLTCKHRKSGHKQRCCGSYYENTAVPNYRSSLKQTYASSPTQNLLTRRSLRALLEAYVAGSLVLKEYHIVTLQSMDPYGPAFPSIGHKDAPLVDKLNGYKARWLWMKSHQQALNDRKSYQLNRLAAIVEKYPHMIKRSKDPGEGARPNYRHISNSLRYYATYVQEDRIFANPTNDSHGGAYWTPPRIHGKFLFRDELLPFVPIKKYLDLYKKMAVKTNEPTADSADGQAKENQIPTAANSAGSHTVSLEVSLKGLTLSASAKPPGIYSLPTEPPKRVEQHFSSRLWKYYDISQRHKEVIADIPIVRNMYAHDEAQIDWLEGILEACAGLEEEDGKGID